MNDKLNVFHWMVTFVTALCLILFWVIIDDQRKSTMSSLENNDSIQKKDVNAAVGKHDDFDKRLIQMSNTQRNHKDTIDSHYADFIKTRNDIKEEIERIFYKLDEMDRRFNSKIDAVLDRIQNVEDDLSDDIADLRSDIRNNKNSIKDISTIVDQHELLLNPPKEEKGRKKK